MLHRYGNSRAIRDHTVLPATRGRGDIPVVCSPNAVGIFERGGRGGSEAVKTR